VPLGFSCSYSRRADSTACLLRITFYEDFVFPKDNATATDRDGGVGSGRTAWGRGGICSDPTSDRGPTDALAHRRPAVPAANGSAADAITDGGATLAAPDADADRDCHSGAAYPHRHPLAPDMDRGTCHMDTGACAAQCDERTACTYLDSGPATSHGNHGSIAANRDSCAGATNLYPFADPDTLPHRAGTGAASWSAGTPRTAGSSGTTRADDCTASTDLYALSDLYADRWTALASVYPAFQWRVWQ
jgi:hypothetical protein